MENPLVVDPSTDAIEYLLRWSVHGSSRRWSDVLSNERRFFGLP
jgi:hypothetical protein